MKIIVATDDSGGIGKNGSIPWDWKEYQQFFKLLTIGSKVAMGMHTWNSLRRPLVDRYNMIITNNESLLWSDVANSHREFGFFTAYAAFNEADWVIGGGQIYQLALKTDEVTEIYVSRIVGNYDCDTFFYVPESFKKITEFRLTNECRVEKYIHG
jgi:dihydrofolate reductase